MPLNMNEIIGIYQQYYFYVSPLIEGDNIATEQQKRQHRHNTKSTIKIIDYQILTTVL